MTTRLTVYEIHVDAHLDDHWAAWLGDVTASRTEPGTTTFLAPVADQAQLHGILTGLRDLGVTLLSVRILQS